jgi:hypothetical protein
MQIEYRFRLRNAANSADALVVTSVRGDAVPFLSSVPSGDGLSLDITTGKVMSGSYSVRLVDDFNGGAGRIFTSLTEDAGNRQQLGQRRAMIEFRIDGGAWQILYAGRLSKYGLNNAMEWELTVSDWMKAEHEFTLFKPNSPTETIASFLARWPNRACILGGPMGSVLGMKDRGGWKMVVRDARPAGATRPRYRLEPLPLGLYTGDGNSYAKFEDLAKGINDAVRSLAKLAGSYGTGAYTTITDTTTPGFGWEYLIVLVDGVPFRAMNLLGVGLYDGTEQDYDFASTHKGKIGIHIDGGEGQSALTLGATVTVRALTILPTDVCPLYVTGNPVDIANTFELEAAIPVNAASVTATKNIIGTSANLIIPVTGPMELGKLLEDCVYGPFGIGTRPDTVDGSIEFFCSRIFANTPPGTVITSADVVNGSTSAFELDTADAIKQLNFQHQKLSRSTAVPQGITSQIERVERQNGDPGSIGTGVVEYTVPGMVTFVNANFDVKKWVDGQAHLLFDRRGRGSMRAKTTLLRGAAGNGVRIGDEVILQLPQIPNKNKRYGDDNTVGGRAMQVVHWTPRVKGIEVDLEDSGPNAQPIATVPTLSIAASVTDPRNIASLTITNAAALIAAGYAVRIQVAVTTGGVAAATDYSDYKYLTNTEIPTAAFDLPRFSMGLRVFAQARAEKVSLGRPSNWSSTVNVTLNALNAPTALTATPNGADGSQCTLRWTNGANAGDCHLDVFVRVQGSAFSTATYRDTLPPGTVEYVMTGLTQGALLTATVQSRYAETGDSSAVTDVNFTAGATLVVLPAPTIADAYSIPPNNVGRFNVADLIQYKMGASNSGAPQPIYGLVVKATVFPTFVELHEAVETAIGSGVYGAFAMVQKLASVSGDWTKFTRIGTNDRLKRQLKARHVADGYTASAFTPVFTIDMSVNDPVANYVIDFSNDIFLGTIEDPLIGSVGANKIGLHGSSTAIPAAVTDFNSRGLIRMFAKVNSTDADTLDGVPDGGTYGRVIGADLSSGRVIKAPRSIQLDGQIRSVVQTLTYEIPNAEFDIWESNSQPHAWSVDTGDSSVAAKETSVVFSGDASCKFSFGAGGAAGTFRGLTTNDLTKGAFCIPLLPGTWYRFIFATRCSSMASSPSWRATITHNVAATLISQQTFPFRAANKFQIDVMTFMVPTNAEPLSKLEIQFTRNSTTATDFWIDGTQLANKGTQRVAILTSGTSWTVPSDFNPLNNMVELWGGGGGGAPGTTNANGGGGGGGAGYRFQRNFDPGLAATVAFVIGSGGGPSTVGGDTTWNAGAVVAKGGSGASASTSGAGGGVGSGGTGGNSGGTGGGGSVGTGNRGGGGGGGAGSNGGTGGAGSAGSNVAGGAGGSGAAPNGGASGVAGSGTGGNSTYWTSTDDGTSTAGAGGGGGGAAPGGGGGATGGNYGGGGSGGGSAAGVAGSGSTGKQGCIVISWTTPVA